MKSFSDELPNLDKKQAEATAQGMVNANLKLNDIAFVQSKHSTALILLGIGVLACFVVSLLILAKLAH